MVVIIQVKSQKFLFFAGRYKIEQKEAVKILGYLLNNKLNRQTYLNSIISKVNLRAYTVGLNSKYVSLQAKRIVYTALMISIIRYGAGRMTSLHDNQIAKINTLILKYKEKY